MQWHPRSPSTEPRPRQDDPTAPTLLLRQPYPVLLPKKTTEPPTWSRHFSHRRSDVFILVLKLPSSLHSPPKATCPSVGSARRSAPHSPTPRWPCRCPFSKATNPNGHSSEPMNPKSDHPPSPPTRPSCTTTTNQPTDASAPKSLPTSPGPASKPPRSSRRSSHAASASSTSTSAAPSTLSTAKAPAAPSWIHPANWPRCC